MSPARMKGKPVPKVAKAQAEALIRSLSEKGFSEREIARRAGFPKGKRGGTIYNVLNPEKRRGGIREAAAGEIVKNLRQSQRMLLLRDYGTVWVEPANWKERSKIGSHWRAVKLAREAGDWEGLKKLRGRSVTVIDQGKRSKLKLLSDLDRDALDRLEDEGRLQPDEIARYRRKAAKSRTDDRREP